MTVFARQRWDRDLKLFWIWVLGFAFFWPLFNLIIHGELLPYTSVISSILNGLIAIWARPRWGDYLEETTLTSKGSPRRATKGDS